MKDDQHESNSLGKLIQSLIALLSLHKKFPVWAVLLLVLFGSGGIFYSFRDYVRRNDPSSNAIYDGPPALPVTLSSSFFPPVGTSLPVGVFIEIENTSNETIPNVKTTIDTAGARIQSCDFRTAAKLSSPPQMYVDNIYGGDLEALLPDGRIEVYCLVEGPQRVIVNVNSTESTGKSLGHANQSFERSTAGSSSFLTFLKVIAGAVVIVLALCVSYLLFGLTGRLAHRLGLNTK